MSPKFSPLEMEMVRHIPPGGNWMDIPESVPSQRLAQIRKNGGGRTTYYGRLRWDKPSYTISTYFNRIGNGCYVHPEQDRLISIREGARLQSFPDSFRFMGSKPAKYKQIGNAIPPLLAFSIANTVKKHIRYNSFVDLFAGAGGLSLGFSMNDLKPIAAIEMEKPYFDTYVENHRSDSTNGFVCGNICDVKNQRKIIDAASTHKVDLVAGGPPCQGFSLAGWYDKNDLRNLLFKEFVSTVSRLSPRVFILENVMGMLSMDKGNFVKQIISEFEQIGYHIHGPWKLNAANFGVPQKRKRVFIIGSSKKGAIDQPTPIIENEEEFVTVRDAIYGLPLLSFGDGTECVEFTKNPTSQYQKFLMGKVPAKEFVKIISKIKYEKIIA